MRVLIIGGTGMLGHKLSDVLASSPRLDVHCSVRGRETPRIGNAHAITYHLGIAIDGDTAKLRALLEDLSPDIVVNAIGAIKQKNLSENLEDTFFLNGALPHALALLNPNPNARVIHFSTDCVFVGDRGGYAEGERPDAQDLYGRSKACGELDYGRHLTIRTSIIGFELGGHLGLLSWLFRQPQGTPLKGYRRAIFSGLPTITLSRTVLNLMSGNSELAGLFHVASQPINKFELLSRISARFGLDHPFVPDDTIRIDRSLSDVRFRRATGTVTPDWDTLIDELHEDYQAGSYDRLYHDLRMQTS
jgi:dTDP-4-dehydrorhamnose reductase